MLGEDDTWHELSLYYVFDFPERHKYYDLAEFHGVEGFYDTKRIRMLK